MHLIKDPYLPWHGKFPYEQLDVKLKQLGHPGISPRSTAKEVNDILFDLMAGGYVTAEDRLAWDALRNLPMRLAVDFFMFWLRQSENDLLNSAESWDRPMPVEMPDCRVLADAPPDLAKAIPLAVSFDPRPNTEPVTMDQRLIPPELVDIGPVSYDETVILGREDGEG